MSIKKIAEVVSALGVPVNELSKNALSKPTTELGEGLGNLFWLLFSPIHAARSTLEPRINRFREEIEARVSEIPIERLIEPPLNIVGPTLEAARFHIEHEEIRALFAQLIASSMDVSKQELIHPSFVEIIKQMSPFDARVLKLLIDDENLPIASIVASSNLHNDKYKDISRNIIEDIVPFPDINLANIQYYCSSLQNIRRLSIINVNMEKIFTDEGRYDSLNNHHELSKIIEEFSTFAKYPEYKDSTIGYKKGIWNFTIYGKIFIDCCVVSPTYK